MTIRVCDCRMIWRDNNCGAQWYRTGARTEETHVVGDFLESALECDGCHGLLHG